MGLFFTKWFQWLKGKDSKTCPEKEECLKALQLYLDGEADVQLEAKLKHKLEKCMCCIEHYNLDRSIKDAIKSKIQPKQCPEELANSIRIKIRDNA
jgi:anti-sigma factor (TIGR02949 family)